MIDVSEVVTAPDLAQVFTVLRSTGAFVGGVWTSQTTSIQLQGTISSASESEIEMIPQGDVVHELRVFYSDQPIFKTQEGIGSPGGSSDVIVWRGQQYRILRVAQYQDYGYYRAIGTRLSTGA
jgi:hypothetical protein